MKQTVQLTLKIDPEKFEAQRKLLNELCGATYDEDQHHAEGLAKLCDQIAKQMARQAKPRKLSRLRKGDKANFATMQRAHENGDLCLASSVRKADGAQVALVCAAGQEPNGDYILSPLAVMVEGNPYELFEDPTRDQEPETA